MAQDAHQYLIELAGPNGIAKSQLLAILERTVKEHNYKVLLTTTSTITVEAPQLGAVKNA